MIIPIAKPPSVGLPQGPGSQQDAQEQNGGILGTNPPPAMDGAAPLPPSPPQVEFDHD
ncbi:hypothetical protein VTN02DRAFT_5707 [Thermoascus thermophilus]